MFVRLHRHTRGPHSITSFSEYRVVMKKVMRVIKEAHNVEKKRRQSFRNKKTDEWISRKQKAKAFIRDIRRKAIGKEIIEKLDDIFGRGSSKEIEKATITEKIIERIEELSKSQRNNSKHGRR